MYKPKVSAAIDDQEELEEEEEPMQPVKKESKQEKAEPERLELSREDILGAAKEHIQRAVALLNYLE